MSSNALLEVTADNLQALEEKVFRTIELLKAAREAKAAAEREAARLRESLDQRDGELQHLRDDIMALRREREEIRGRVEKIMKEIDAIAEGE